MAGLIGPAISGITGLASAFKGPSAAERILQQMAEQELAKSQGFFSLRDDILNEGRGLRDIIAQNQQIFAPGGEMAGGFSFANSGIKNPLTGEALPFNSAEQFASHGAQPVAASQAMLSILMPLLAQHNFGGGQSGQAAGFEQQREGAVGDALGGALQNLLSSGFLEKILGGSGGGSGMDFTGSLGRGPQGLL